MRRYIVSLLITGTVWAQTDFDKLISKAGTKYLGEYSKFEDKEVYLKQIMPWSSKQCLLS